MYRAFKTKASLFSNISINPEALVTSGGLKYKIQEFFLEPDEKGVLDATEIWDTWFPSIRADVFISHSSRDVENARKMASWLYSVFGIKSFIDSEVWGFADDLLAEVDKKYAKNENKENSYIYEKRNATTANVHMMLTYALTRMIDQTECIFFLESENSIPIKDNEFEKTFSPWIFHELATIDLITIRNPVREHCFSKSAAANEGVLQENLLKISYPAVSRRLIPLSFQKLKAWQGQGLNSVNSLDWLYEKYGDNLKVLHG